MSKFEQIPELETVENFIENNQELQEKLEESPMPALDEVFVQKEVEETQERIDSLRQEIGQEQNESVLENPPLEEPIEQEIDSFDEEKNLIGRRTTTIFRNFNSSGNSQIESSEKKPKKKKNAFVKFLAKILFSKEEYQSFIGSYEKGQGMIDKAENFVAGKGERKKE